MTDKLRLIERTNANLTEDEWVSQIHDGLWEEIQLALGGNDWTTVDRLLTKAIGIESKQKKVVARGAIATRAAKPGKEGEDPKCGDWISTGKQGGQEYVMVRWEL